MASGKRKKRKTHQKASSSHNNGSNPGQKPIPKSFVIRSGSVKSSSIYDLVLNMRKFFEPNTATRLKERKMNKLKDYTSIAGPMGISHFIIFGQTLLHATLRMSRFPRGPTFYFNILEYSLMKDITKLSRRPKTHDGSAFQSSPLVILNGFYNDDDDQVADQPEQQNQSMEELKKKKLKHKHHPENENTSSSSSTRPLKSRELRLMATFIQNMFPPIVLSKMTMKDARRVVLFHYENGLIYVRHYTIHLHTKDLNLSKPIRKILDATSSRNSSLHQHRRMNGIEEEEKNHHYTSSTSEKRSSKKLIKDLEKVDDLADFILNQINAESDVEEELIPIMDESIKKRNGSNNVENKNNNSLFLSEIGNTINNSSNNNDEDEREEEVDDDDDNYNDGNDDIHSNLGNISSQSVAHGSSKKQKAVSVIEVGPRLTLELFKIQQDFCEGKIMYSKTGMIGDKSDMEALLDMSVENMDNHEGDIERASEEEDDEEEEEEEESHWQDEEMASEEEKSNVNSDIED